MKRSLLAAVCMSIAFAAAALCDVIGDVLHKTVTSARALGRFAFDRLVFGPIKLDDGKPASTRPLVIAKAFHARIVKRQRPTIEADWRMCPST